MRPAPHSDLRDADVRLPQDGGPWRPRRPDISANAWESCCSVCPRSPTVAPLSDTSGGTDRAAAVARAYDSGILATGSR